jgi:hypothetical protein
MTVNRWQMTVGSNFWVMLTVICQLEPAAEVLLMPGWLALALLMLRVFANDPHHAAAGDDLALDANLLD